MIILKTDSATELENNGPVVKSGLRHRPFTADNTGSIPVGDHLSFGQQKYCCEKNDKLWHIILLCVVYI